MDDEKLKITTGLLDKAYAIGKIIEEVGGEKGYHWSGTLVAYKEDPLTVRDVILPQSQEVSKTGHSSKRSKEEQLENLKLETGREYKNVGGIFGKGDDSIMVWYIFQNETHYCNAAVDVKRNGEGGFVIIDKPEFMEIVEEGLSYDESPLRKYIKETVKFE